MAWSINEPDITSADHPKVNSTAAGVPTDRDDRRPGGLRGAEERR